MLNRINQKETISSFNYKMSIYDSQVCNLQGESHNFPPPIFLELSGFKDSGTGVKRYTQAQNLQLKFIFTTSKIAFKLKKIKKYLFNDNF